MKQILFVLLVFSFHISQAQDVAVADTLRQLVQRWNIAHSTKDTSAFSHLYDANIFYYGTRISRKIAVNKKNDFLIKNPAYLQQIIGFIIIDTINNDEWKCTFTKKVTIKSGSKDYVSYLIFKRVNTQWKIVTESDLTTDRNLANKKINAQKIPLDATLGDYNGDGKKEYMWLVKPETTEDMDCIGACDCYMRFSDTNIPPIKLANCIGGLPTDLGDLNKNGSDEVGLLPEWFTSCWVAYHVWTFIDGKWVNAVEPFSTHCNQWEKEIVPIEIDRKRDGYVIIRYSSSADEIKSKSVKISR